MTMRAVRCRSIQAATRRESSGDSAPSKKRDHSSASGRGVEPTDYVPCEGSRIVHDGVEYRISWSYIALGREVLDCPEWLLELVGKRAG